MLCTVITGPVTLKYLEQYYGQLESKDCIRVTFRKLILLYHPGLRAEEFVYQKLDKPKPPRLTESEALGQTMIEAGNDFGPGTNYGEVILL